jgi:cytochrome c peroxidase
MTYRFLFPMLTVLCTVALGQVVHPPAEVPPSLSTIPVPQPPPQKLAEYVSDPAKLAVLGKALFWDMQLGSDGVQACASCHYNAGADSRFINQVNPGSDGAFQFVPGPNQPLSASRFPLTGNDRVGSQGVYPRTFKDIDPNGGPDLFDGPNPADTIFQVNGKSVRRVEPRNTTSVINAAFTHRNFWDGRASHFFNGRNPFGDLVPAL